MKPETKKTRWLQASGFRFQADGFTLIELLVSMAVFVSITTIVLASFRTGATSLELRGGADIASSVIADALARGTAGAATDVCIDGGGEKSVRSVTATACPTGTMLVSEVPKGWGVAFGTGSPEVIKLFADLDGDGAAAASEVVEEVPYADSRFVKASGAAPSVTATSLVFVPPDPRALINGETIENEATLTLTHDRTGKSRTLRFNRVSRRVDVMSE